MCLYSFEVIERLRAEGHPIGPGAAGENVTVGAVDWSLVVPGAEMRLGNEVLLEVTAYATPCWKNARWFRDGDADRMSQPGTRRSSSTLVSFGGAIPWRSREADPSTAAARSACSNPHHRGPDFSARAG